MLLGTGVLPDDIVPGIFSIRDGPKLAAVYEKFRRLKLYNVCD